MSTLRQSVCCALLGLIVWATCAHAQEPAPSETPAAVTAAQDATGPVAVPVPSEKAMRYYHSGNKVWLGGLVLEFFLPACILFTGLSAFIRSRVARVKGGWPVTLALYWVAFVVISALITLPWDYYIGFVRPHSFDLSNQTLAKFFQDWAIGLALNAVIGALFLWIPYLVLRNSPKRWWIYTSALAVPFIVLQILVSPILIAPLFNEFGPMQDKALEAKILAIADRANIEGGDVFEVKKSEDTKAVNAYVTGFMGTKRIVLWDTLLAKLDEREALFVMAHEMGHYVLGHVLQMIFVAPLLVALALFSVHRVSGYLIHRFQNRFGFTELSDPAALPLIMLVAGIASFVVSPAMLAFSRHNEHEADRFALEITHDNYAGATAFVKLQQENLGNPRPDWFVKVWRGSHPSLGERIEFCNTYKPWAEGQKGHYENRFKPGSPTP